MEYYGADNVTRIMEVYRERVDDKNDLKSFIKEKGLLGEYLYNTVQKMNGTYPRLICRTQKNFNGREDMEIIKYRDTTFYTEETEVVGDVSNYRKYYVEIPRFTNDEKFYWKENNKYGVKECTLDYGPFQMNCILKADNEVTIEVKYTRCENKHRNNVTIAMIDVYEGTNEVIDEAIKKWVESFADDFVLAGWKTILRDASVKSKEQINNRKELRKEDLTEKKKAYSKKKQKHKKTIVA